jgi:outer membrane protein OmpA-like peptidoglycan-associated protein
VSLLRFEGHTDSDGSEMNQTLSEKERQRLKSFD